MLDTVTGTAPEPGDYRAALTALRALAEKTAGTLTAVVERPRAELHVGDQVIVYGRAGGRSNTRDPGRIAKIGRAWVTIGEGRTAQRFHRDSQRAESGYGSPGYFCTPDQDEYDRAVSAARRALVEHGLIVGRCPNGARVPDGHVLAIAALLDALDSTAR